MVTELKQALRLVQKHERMGAISNREATVRKVDVLMDHTMRVPKLSERHIRAMHDVYVQACAC